MLTLVFIEWAVQPGKTHKTKTLRINDDNERLQRCITFLRIRPSLSHVDLLDL